MSNRLLCLGLTSLALLVPSLVHAQTAPTAAPAAPPASSSTPGETKKVEEAKKVEETKKPEEAKKVEETKKPEEAKKVEETKKPEKPQEAKKLDDSGKGSASKTACKVDRECAAREVCQDGFCAVPTGPLAESKAANDAEAPKQAKDEIDRFGRTDDDVEEILEDKPPRENYYLGARFRDFIVPGFFFDLFVDGGPNLVNVFSGGPEFMMQNGALVAIFSVTVPYADFSMDPFVFKSKSEPDKAYEMIESSLKVITVSADILGRIPFDRKERFSLLLGGGVGISGVFGDLGRSQVYPTSPGAPDPDDSSKWAKCPGTPKAPKPWGEYCGSDNEHYGDYKEPSWANGGSKPFLFPYLALPHVAFEVRPIQEVSLRLDTGFSITGFFFGLGAGGRLPI
jgi:hypothetical protein